MSSVSTKEALLTLIDDIEIIARQLVDNSVAPKQQRLSDQELHAIVNLLIAKDKDLKDTIKVAGEQAAVEQLMGQVQAELTKVDGAIHNLEQQLYDAHHSLSTGIHQAKQKLKSIACANKRPVNTEELIRYAHRISSTHAVSAPATWQQGDPRRPYPTDLEMRAGFLGQNGQLLHNQGHLSDPLARHHHHADSGQAGSGGMFAWLPSGECSIMTGGGAGGAAGGAGAPHTAAHVVQKKQQDDVEVMSTDSSSSSSSDSQ